MAITTGLSGNEIYCLAKKSFKPGNLLVGNSVYSLGLLNSLISSFNVVLGGEVDAFTTLIKDGRESAYQRLVKEGITNHATGITGVTSEFILHQSNMEFLSIGSAIHADNANDKSEFTSSANAQDLYALWDTGYQPICFAFGNVAYSIGVGRGILGGLKMLARGEIKEYSDMFNVTRHLALERILQHARQKNANAVLGIQTTVLNYGMVNEMLMIGTACKHPSIASTLPNQIISSDMTNIEMWNMASLGYAPLKLLLGTSVFSLGLVGGVTSVFKSFVRGEINELTRLIYDARENAIGLINDEAKSIGADDVVGVKTYVYQLGNGLVEFLAIGTAVKKIPEMKTQTEQLPPQAIMQDQETFLDVSKGNFTSNLNKGGKNTASLVNMVRVIVIIIVLIAVFISKMHNH